MRPALRFSDVKENRTNEIQNRWFISRKSFSVTPLQVGPPEKQRAHHRLLHPADPGGPEVPARQPDSPQGHQGGYEDASLQLTQPLRRVYTSDNKHKCKRARGGGLRSAFLRNMLMFMIINVTYSELHVCRRNKGAQMGILTLPSPFYVSYAHPVLITPPSPSVIRVNRL